MKCVKSINIYHVLVTIISLGTFFFIGSIIQVEAVKKNGTLLEDYNNLKELVGDIRNGNFSDDQISLNDFKNSDAYQHADENMHDCIKLAAKIGHNLGDREIVHCFEDANYFKQKYSIGNNKTNKTNIKGADSINNATSADTNATSADTNVTGSSSDTNATSADTNVTGSSSDTNATSADTNASRISITDIFNRPYFKIS
jgi:hypothetical protein